MEIKGEKYMEDYISITALLKDGGDKQLQITPEMLGELSLSIKKNGSEVVQLKDRPIVIAGILISSKDIGERVIICGDYKGDE